MYLDLVKNGVINLFNLQIKDKELECFCFNVNFVIKVENEWYRISPALLFTRVFGSYRCIGINEGLKFSQIQDLDMLQSIMIIEDVLNLGCVEWKKFDITNELYKELN